MAETANYKSGTATANFNINQKAATVTAKAQIVERKANITKGTAQATLSGQVSGHKLSAVTLTASSTANATTSGTITPSAAKIVNASGTDVTANYDITYTKGKLTVSKTAIAPVVTIANWTYGGTASKPSVTGNTGSGTVTYKYKVKV